MKPHHLHRLAHTLSLFTTLVLLWLAAGVGIIGADGDRANMMYLSVAAVWLVGSLMAKFRAGGMARVLVAMAVTQALIGAVAIFGGMGRPHSGAWELLLLNGFFVLAFLGAAFLFRRSDKTDFTPRPS